MRPIRPAPFSRWFNAWTATVVFVFMGLGWGMIRNFSPTFDEPVHLASGYTCLVTGGTHCLDFLGHPPFGEKWAALPLWFLHPRTFFEHPDWIGGRIYNYSDRFLYANNVPAGRLLDTARVWCLLTWSVVLTAAVLEWSLRLGGAPGLVCAGVLLAFCPPLISNLALVTTDGCSTVFFFLAFWILSMRPRRRRHWVFGGIAAGLGLASKFNMIVIPAFVVLGLVFESAGSKGSAAKSRKEGVRGFVVASLCAIAALAAAYNFRGLPDYWKGLWDTFGLTQEGRASFFFGDISTTGHALFFPAALAIKTPIPLLVLALVGSAEFIPFSLNAETLWLFLPPVAYFLAVQISKSQLGYRHILPIYPFMIVIAGAGAARLWARSARSRVITAVLGAWLIIGVLRTYPDYLAYFNEAVGGPSQGFRCLADSNVDWGQGLKELAAELARRGNPPIVLSYFGNGDPSYYGIRYVPLAFLSMADRLLQGSALESSDRSDPAFIAVSATNLQGVYFRNQHLFDWLKKREPVFVAGYSIFLYDLSGDPEGRGRLSAMLRAAGR